MDVKFSSLLTQKFTQMLGLIHSEVVIVFVFDEVLVAEDLLDHAVWHMGDEKGLRGLSLVFAVHLQSRRGDVVIIHLLDMLLRRKPVSQVLQQQIVSVSIYNE